MTSLPEAVWLGSPAQAMIGYALWGQWGEIAIDREHAARTARAQMLAEHRHGLTYGPTLAAEFRASLVAVSAVDAAHALDAMYGQLISPDVRSVGPKEGEHGEAHPRVPEASVRHREARRRLDHRVPQALRSPRRRGACHGVAIADGAAPVRNRAFRADERQLQRGSVGSCRRLAGRRPRHLPAESERWRPGGSPVGWGLRSRHQTVDNTASGESRRGSARRGH